MRLASILLAAAAASSCAPAHRSEGVAPASVFADTVTIQLGRTSATRDGRLEITFVRLVSDSRCPVDVTCVWQGDAAVRLRGRSMNGGGIIEATIHSALDPRSFAVGGYSLSLLDLQPYPGAPDSTSARRVSVLVQAIAP